MVVLISSLILHKLEKYSGHVEQPLIITVMDLVAKMGVF
jgi:hypothetical protein